MALHATVQRGIGCMPHAPKSQLQKVCLAPILDMGHSKCMATDDFGHNAFHEMIANRLWP